MKEQRGEKMGGYQERCGSKYVTGLYIICVVKNMKSPETSVISDTCINALPEWFGGNQKKKKKFGEGGGESELYNWLSKE